MNLLAFARELIDIESTSGSEQAAGRWLASQLHDLGYQVTEQPVNNGRFNVLATVDAPAVVFSTHFDCVPPFIPSRISSGRLHGRGSCDAKGILAAQVMAAERLRAAGERRVGLLFVVGEERGSEGAMAANAAAAGTRFLINGEPTDSRLAIATRGVLRVRLHASGRPAHTALPELGESAIEKLVDALVQLRSIPLPSDPLLGPTYYTVVLLEGGIATNVVPPAASAEVNVRTSRPADEVLRCLGPIEHLVRIEEVLRVPEIRFERFDDLGIESAVFPFTTDVPLLTNWGTPLLFGPGSITVAHTAEEHVEIAELEAAVGHYERLARACLAQA
ncbi:MAG TPA: M20/M25/M40 family metallo-hydrolase [Vicinamibacterales bacterium]|nr:M20/M25/M40 family metallo-hydrolase [Vicinamibacterales bacterium]